MSAAMLPEPAAPDRVLRVRVSAVGTPVAGRLRVRRSQEVLRLTRSHGRVVGSRRVPVGSGRPQDGRGVDADRRALDRHREVVEEVLGRLGAVLPDVPGVRLQSLAITSGPRLRALARVETPAGPVLIGGAGPLAAQQLLAGVADLAGVAGAVPPGPAPGWAGAALVLRPPVAAAVLIGVRWLLHGPAGARLQGRRVLPPLTFLDHPVDQIEGEPDDAGLPAGPWAVVDAGRVACPPLDRVTGLPLGRAVWSHDQQRLVRGGSFALTVTADPRWGDAADPPGGGSVQLLTCVEGIRRYEPDGRMRLICLARHGPRGPTFLVGLTARPLTLLRELVSVAGPSAQDGTDHLVNTPSLVLPPAESLERSPDVRIATL